jgi:putative ABC transport system permease protein
MWKILIEEFFGDLKTQKTRAFLTMFAITWGTIAVVLLLAFGEGLKRTFISGLVNAGDRIFMIYGGQTSLTYEGLPKGRSIRLTEEDLKILQRSIPDIDLASVSYGRWGTSLKAGETKTTTFMEGVNPAFEELRRMYPVLGGRFLNSRDLERRRRVVFLGNDIAERLFGADSAVGKTLMIDGLPFTVVGVMQKKLQTSMNNGPDADRAIIPASTFKTIYGRKTVSHLLIRPRDVARSEVVKQEIYRVLGRRHKFDPKDERALSIWDMIEAQKITARISLGIQIFLGVVGGLTLFVAGVGVANIMYVVVRERTREIGIKLAVGARRRHIMSQFVFESLLIAMSGGAIGLFFSVLVILAVRSIPNKSGPLEFLANPSLPWTLALICVGILALIGLFAGLFPARKAASLDPVESLRYE